MSFFNRYFKPAIMLLVVVAVAACHGYVDPATLPQPDPEPTPDPEVEGELTLVASSSSLVADGEEAVTFSVFCTEDETQGGAGNEDDEILPVGVMRI